MVSLPYRYQKKNIALVFPHGFLIDCFRHYKEEDTITHIENLAKMTLILEFTIRRVAFDPNVVAGATSEKAFNEFMNKLGTSSAFAKLNIKALRGTLYIETDPSINALATQESVVAVADKLLKTANLNPIIVARGDSITRWQSTYIKDYYKGSKQQRQELAVFSVDDTLSYLRNKHRPEYDLARKSILDDTLKHYLPD